MTSYPMKIAMIIAGLTFAQTRWNRMSNEHISPSKSKKCVVKCEGKVLPFMPQCIFFRQEYNKQIWKLAQICTILFSINFKVFFFSSLHFYSNVSFQCGEPGLRSHIYPFQPERVGLLAEWLTVGEVICHITRFLFGFVSDSLYAK